MGEAPITSTRCECRPVARPHQNGLLADRASRAGQVLGDPVADPHGRVAVPDPDVDVQAEGQLAAERLPVQLGQLAGSGRVGTTGWSRQWENGWVPPQAEQGSAAPAARAVAASLAARSCLDLGDVAADARVDLDAAVVELRLDRVRGPAGHLRQHSLSGPGEGQRSRIDKLKFQLHAQARSGAAAKAFNTHRRRLYSGRWGLTAPGQPMKALARTLWSSERIRFCPHDGRVHVLKFYCKANADARNQSTIRIGLLCEVTSTSRTMRHRQ